MLAPDLRGYGHSPATSGTVTMAELAADVWGLVDDLGISTAAPVGLSMGGLVAIETALARPDRVWALGLVASTVEPVGDDERRTRRALADRIEAVGIEPLVESLGPRLFGPSVAADTVDGVVAIMRGANPGRGRGGAARTRPAPRPPGSAEGSRDPVVRLHRLTRRLLDGGGDLGTRALPARPDRGQPARGGPSPEPRGAAGRRRRRRQRGWRGPRAGETRS